MKIDFKYCTYKLVKLPDGYTTEKVNEFDNFSAALDAYYSPGIIELAIELSIAGRPFEVLDTLLIDQTAAAVLYK